MNMTRIHLSLAFLMVSSTCHADVLKAGTMFPQMDFLEEDEKQLQTFNPYLGKKSIVFVYASW